MGSTTEKSDIRIALDAMGGDNAPESVIDGAKLALEQDKNLHFIIFGKESIIAPLVDRLPLVKENSTLHFTD